MSQINYKYLNLNGQFNSDSEEFHEKWIPVIFVWRVLILRMNEQHPERRAVVNIVNKQPRTTGKGRPARFGFVKC